MLKNRLALSSAPHVSCNAAAKSAPATTTGWRWTVSLMMRMLAGLAPVSCAHRTLSSAMGAEFGMASSLPDRVTQGQQTLARRRV